jgi:pimeloyl-ACP methyl ester carboxylesterase
MVSAVLQRRTLLGTALSVLLPSRVMAAAETDAFEVQGGQYKSFDGQSLFYRRTGRGAPVLLLHGFLGDGPRTWFATGVAQGLAAAGFQAIAPDARAHGLSAAPVGAGAYPKDVQAMDVEALLRVLGLRSIRLVGYGLGAHTAVRMMARGVAVRRAVLVGSSGRSITETEQLAARYEALILRRGAEPDPTLGVAVQAAIRLQRLNPQALVGLIRSERSTPPSALAKIRTPLLVISGRVERAAASAEPLAALFPNARAEHAEGSHLEVLRDPRFVGLAASFLKAEGAAARFDPPREGPQSRSG